MNNKTALRLLCGLLAQLLLLTGCKGPTDSTVSTSLPEDFPLDGAITTGTEATTTTAGGTTTAATTAPATVIDKPITPVTKPGLPPAVPTPTSPPPQPETFPYDKLPVIHINTSNGSNDFATKYTREDKLQGRIDYTDATVSVKNCDAGYTMDTIPPR